MALSRLPGYIARHNAHFPDKPLPYSVYVWSGFFHYALQGLWVLAAFVLTFGGLARETANGTALFTLGLPVRRSHLFLIRAAMAWAQSIVLGVGAALLIPLVSRFVGESYPLDQAVAFGALMSSAGLAILALGLLLSEIFEGEFTTPVVGLCAITTRLFQLQGPHLARLERLRRDERGRLHRSANAVAPWSHTLGWSDCLRLCLPPVADWCDIARSPP